MFVLSSMLTIVTAIFLYKQIQKQDELLAFQSEVENQKNIILYLQSLYDETCEERIVDSSDGTKSNKTKKICTPKHNSRQRSEALKGYIQLTGENANLTFAHLENTNFFNFNFKKANLHGVNLDEAILRRANLQMVELIISNLSKAELQKADLRGANLSRANIGEANLKWANLEMANLEGANLQGADLQEANLRGARLTCNSLKLAKNWQYAYRNDDLACGKPIPNIR